jgi:hypothetical protein
MNLDISDIIGIIIMKQYTLHMSIIIFNYENVRDTVPISVSIYVLESTVV